MPMTPRTCLYLYFYHFYCTKKKISKLKNLIYKKLGNTSTEQPDPQYFVGAEQYFIGAPATCAPEVPATCAPEASAALVLITPAPRALAPPK
jgi:hypothetical protein